MLTEISIRSFKPGEVRYMRADGGGLYLEVLPNGSRYWWLIVRGANKKTKKYKLGDYPEVGIKTARELCVLKRREVGLSVGKPPSDLRFEELAWDWYNTKIMPLRESYRKDVKGRLENHVLPPFIGRLAASITAFDILPVVKGLDNAGFHDSARKILGIYGQIFRYGMPPMGPIMADPTAGIVKHLAPKSKKHFASLTDRRDVTKLMREITIYRSGRVRYALLFSVYTFCRPGEVAEARWSEIDFTRAEWRKPGEKMKNGEPHIVPLSKQAVEALRGEERLLAACGVSSPYVFPNTRNPEKHMTKDTVRVALRSIGYSKEELTSHGLRAMASTLLNESGLWSIDAIELQLAHTDKDHVRADYNFASKLPERTRMMQWWADELDRLRDAKAEEDIKEEPC